MTKIIEMLLERVKFRDVLAFTVVAASFVYFFWVSTDKSQLNSHVGDIKTALVAIISAIGGFYWGSSDSSRNKDKALEAMADSHKAIAESERATASVVVSTKTAVVNAADSSTEDDKNQGS